MTDDSADSRRLAGLRRALALCLLPGAALAQQVPPNAPSAGSLLQQAQPSTPAAPVLGKPPAELVLPRAVSAPTTGGPTVAVKAFRIAGIDAQRAAPLLPMLQKYTGAAKTLLDLEDAAKDVEVALQRQGFFLAQVYVPEQQLVDGTVTLQVLIGRLGAVKIESEPGVKVAPEFMDRIIALLRGNPVAERELIERALFTLGDLRGITISSSLTPGDKVGQADLTIKVAAAKGSAYSLEADNGGSIFTGRYRVFASGEWFNLAGRGDVFSLRGQASTNAGSAFVRAAWLTPINERGTKFGLAASFLKYRLGDELEPLDADGTASALSFQLLHPQIRSRNANLFFVGSADVRKFDDRVNTYPLKIKKGVTSYVTLGVVGDFRDTLGGGGISNYTATLVGGKLELDTPDEQVLDQQTYQSAGSYGKLALTGSRLQVLPNKDYLYFNAAAQIASKNLDSSEKFSLGGPSGVRAYPAPETPSDSGLIVGWEYRKPLAIEALPGDWILGVFGDYGWGRQHVDPLPSDVENTRKLFGHGVGLTYGNATGLIVKGYVAVRGNTKAQSDDSRARAYFQLSQQF
ncbi:MAG: ShlB/FhaC/HecB family hemolysin secretion/activation protein [Piscinibacter sp.]|nr:ShlB/FhaC/HecB family hemolysin secretion/activation protein [Piscinibacter sp.]